MYERNMDINNRLGFGSGMGTQQVLRIATPILMQARPLNSNNSQTSSSGGDDDPLCRGCAPDSDDVEPIPDGEPFTIEPSGPSWWFWGGLAVLALGAAGGAGYWFWWRPRQAAQEAEEV